jgi:hypothetical protein
MPSDHKSETVCASRPSLDAAMAAPSSSCGFSLGFVLYFRVFGDRRTGQHTLNLLMLFWHRRCFEAIIAKSGCCSDSRISF